MWRELTLYPLATLETTLIPTSALAASTPREHLPDRIHLFLAANHDGAAPDENQRQRGGTCRRKRYSLLQWSRLNNETVV